MPASSTLVTTYSFAGRGRRSFSIPTLIPISAALTVENKAVFPASSSSALAVAFNLSVSRKAHSQQCVSIRNFIEPPRLRINFIVEVRADPTFTVVHTQPAFLRLRLVRHQPCDRLSVPRDDDFLARRHLHQQPREMRFRFMHVHDFHAPILV